MKLIVEGQYKGLYELVENFSVTNSYIKRIASLKEGTSLVEKDGKQFECVAAYSFPVSRPNQKNLNERIYTDKLWENVIKKQKEVWEGCFGLTDHPKDEGSVKDGFCVWHNLRFNEDKSLVIADAYLYGYWGEQAQKAIKAGGKIGLSSVGYGDFKEDDITIEESSFQIDRVADWVLNPSYQVFGTSENNIDIEKSENTLSILNLDNKKLHEEDRGMKINTNKIKSLEERDFRHKISNALEDISKISSSFDKLSEYEEILSYFDDTDFAVDIKETVKSEISKLRSSIKQLESEASELETKSIKDYKEEHVSLKSDYNNMMEKYNVAVSLLNELRNFSKNLEELYKLEKATKNGMVTAKEYNELLKYVDSLEKVIEKHEETQNILKKENETIKSKLDNKILEETEKKILERKSKVEDYINTKKEEQELQLKQEEENKLKAAEEHAAKLKKIKEEKEAELKRIEESINVTNDNDVLEYYEDLVVAVPEVEIIKKDILKCKTVVEAQNTYLRLSDLIESSGLTDSIKNKSKSKLNESTSDIIGKVDSSIPLIHETWI